jgi:Fibronectin type III domain
MAISWGGFSGHLRVGIEVRHDGYDTWTPSINVYVDYYVQCDSTWNFGDSQRLNIWGSVGGGWDFYNDLGKNGVKFIGTAVVGGQGQSYGGGPVYHFAGGITGHYQGATPSHGIDWALPARPPNVPTNPPMWVTEVTSNSARINVNPADGRGAGVDAYEVAISHPGPSWGGWHQSWGGGTGYATNLQPNTVYEAAARAHNWVGWSGWTYSGHFRTGAAAPGAPGAPSNSEVGQTQARVSWGAPGFTGGSAILSYGIQVSRNSGFTDVVQDFDTGNATTNRLLTGLTPGQQYWVRVRARNGVGWSGYTGATNFTTLAGTPSILTPTNGSTIGTAIIDVNISALGIAGDRTITLEVARNNTFTEDLRTVELRPAGASSNNQYRLTDPDEYLLNGVWYARAKVTNRTSGYVTPWSTVVSFTQSHTPSASIQGPTQGITQRYAATTQFSFRFQDVASPNDWMTNYQLLIENNATGEVIHDSGKTALESSPANPIITVSIPLAAALKNVVMRWRVKVWDRGNQESGWTPYSVFSLADTPNVSISYPQAALPVDTGAPTFTWTVSIPSGGQIATTRVTVREALTNTLVWEKMLTGPVLDATPETTILINERSYSVTIVVTDTVGLMGEASTLFDTSYQAPDPIRYTVATELVNSNGYVEINWEGQAADSRHVAWRVYRRDLPSTDWKLIADLNDEGTRYWRDYLVKSGGRYMYTVSQVADRSGVLLESPVGVRQIGDAARAESFVAATDINKYWIISEDRPELTVRLDGVTSAGESEEYEDETFLIIGRGRHRDYGDRLGFTGSFTVQIRQPERQSQLRLKIEELRRARETYWLRTPFGRLFQIALGNLSWDPMAGTGPMEMGDLTVPWEEVA